jgi:hypothetical protein
MILALHYWGEQSKLFFRTTGVFIALLILIACFQATGISFFLAKLFTGKAMEVLKVAFGFAPANTYQFALGVSFGFALVYEFIVLVFSRNGQTWQAYGFTALVILLSLASYLEIVKDAAPYYIGGLNVMKAAPALVASLPALAHLVIAEGLVNHSLSFTELSGELVALETGYQQAKAKILAAKTKPNSAKFGQIQPNSAGPRPIPANPGQSFNLNLKRAN